MSKKRTCLCCEKNYSFCPNCNTKLPRWMMEFDNEVCKEVFNIISAYNMGIKTKDDVASVLYKYNVTDFSVFKESIRNKLNELFPPELLTVITPSEEVSVNEFIPPVETFEEKTPKKRGRKNKSMDMVLNNE